MTRPGRLTDVQRRYLQLIDERGTLTQGWGGYGSTRTVRILAERGLVMLKQRPDVPWRAQITTAGREALAVSDD